MAKLQDAADEKAEALQERMEAASAKRQANLDGIVAKGHAETEKVRAAAKRMTKCQKKAEISLEVAARRLEALNEVIAKGAAEGLKVDAAKAKLQAEAEAKV